MREIAGGAGGPDRSCWQHPNVLTPPMSKRPFHQLAPLSSSSPFHRPSARPPSAARHPCVRAAASAMLCARCGTPLPAMPSADDFCVSSVRGLLYRKSQVCRVDEKQDGDSLRGACPGHGNQDV